MIFRFVPCLFFVAVCFSKITAGEISAYRVPELKGKYLFRPSQASIVSGALKKISPSLSNIPKNAKLTWTVSGIKEGKYYIQSLRSIEKTYGLAINGKPVFLSSFAGAVPYRSELVAICQTENTIHVKNGDIIKWCSPVANLLGGISLVESRDKTRIRLWDDNAFKKDPCELTAKFIFSSDDPGEKGFRFNLKNVSGKKDTFSIKCLIKDYFQNNISSYSEEGVMLENGARYSKEIYFQTGNSDRYIACVSVADSNGDSRELLEDMLTDKLNGLRKKIWLKEKWEWFPVADKKDKASRTILSPKVFSGNEKWEKSKNVPPFSSKSTKYGRFHVVWFKKKFTIPQEFMNKRMFIHVSRAAAEARIFINGKEVGGHLSPVSAFEFDISEVLKTGENEILVGLRDNLAVVDQLALEKEDAALEFWAPKRIRYGLGEIYIYSTNDFPIKDVFVKTSYRNKNIELEITMPENLPPGRYVISNKVFLKGEKVLELADHIFNHEKGQPVVKLKKPWSNPILWGPERFPLLQLSTELRNEKGSILDRIDTRFGFREFYADDKNLVWNGKVVKFSSRPFLNPWGGNLNSTNSRRSIRKTLRKVKENECRMLRHIYACEDFSDIADEEGVVYAQGGMTVVGLTEKILDNNKYWDSVYQFDKDMILGMRNHPSIVTWYLTNECFGESREKNGKRLRALGEKILKIDDSRLIEFGCDLDLNGYNSIVSTHYPADVDALRKPEAFFPEAAYWRYFDQKFFPGMKVPAGMCEKVANVYDKSPITWGFKPIIVNETCWIVFFKPPDGFTKFFSDHAYAAIGAVEKAHDIANTWFARGQRDAEVSAITLWKLILKSPNWISLPRYDINILQKYNKFYSGEKVTYDINLTRDIFNEADILYRWNLKKGDQILDSGEKQLHFTSSEMKREKINLELPFVDRPEELKLVISMCDMKKPSVAHQTEQSISVYLPSGHSSPSSDSSKKEKYAKIASSLKISVFDKVGETFGRLLSLLENPRRIKSIDAGLAVSTELLIIAEDQVVSEKEGKIIHDFARKGGKVLILNQKLSPEWWPGHPNVSTRTASINYTFRPDHPLLNGISNDEIKFWYPAHKVTEKAYLKPASGNYRVVIEPGGPQGMVYAGLLEFPVGNGDIICSQLLLAESLDKNPVAVKLWQNILNYCENYTPALKKAGFIGSENGPYHSLLKRHDVDVKSISSDGLDKYSVVLLEAASELSSEDIGKLRKWVENGGTLLVHGTDLKSLDRISEICNVEIQIHPAEFPNWSGRAIRTIQAEETAGLTNYDLFWKSRSKSSNYHPSFTSPKTNYDKIGKWLISCERGQSLTFPSYIVKLASGKGKILLENINLESERAEAQIHCGRILSTILTNLGVRIREKDKKKIKIPEMKYTPIDISSFLNRSFFDEKAGDGKGGWTDSGPEWDLDAFPVNENIKELNGISFRIEKPKSCLVFHSKHRPESKLPLKARFPVEKKADSIAFLQTSAWTKKGTHGAYFVNFEDGTKSVIKLIGGANLRDWNNNRPKSPFFFEVDTVTKVAWSTQLKTSAKASLYCMEWLNPYPEKKIKSIDFESEGDAVLILLGISVGHLKNPPESKVRSSRQKIAKAKRTMEEARNLLRRDKNSLKAENLLLKAIKTAPDLTETSLFLGDFYVARKEWRKAIEIYKNLLVFVPDQLEAYHKLGLCYEQERDLTNAIKTYQASLSVNLNQPEVLEALEAAKKKSEYDKQ